MHRQQSTGSTEKGCDSQNMDKRRTAVNIGCICLIFLFIFGFYKCIQWDNTSRREQEEAKEQKILRKEYMELIRVNLRSQLNNIDLEQKDGSIVNLGEKYGNKFMDKKGN